MCRIYDTKSKLEDIAQLQWYSLWKTKDTNGLLPGLHCDNKSFVRATKLLYGETTQFLLLKNISLNSEAGSLTPSLSAAP